MLVRNEIKSEPRLRMTSPRKTLATILPDAPLLPLQRYLAAAERPDTDHNLQQIRAVKQSRIGTRRNARGHSRTNRPNWTRALPLMQEKARRERRGGSILRRGGGYPTCTLFSFQKAGSSWSSNRAGEGAALPPPSSSSTPSNSIASAAEAEEDYRGWVGRRRWRIGDGGGGGGGSCDWVLV